MLWVDFGDLAFQPLRLIIATSLHGFLGGGGVAAGGGGVAAEEVPPLKEKKRFLPPASAVEVSKTEPSVCVSVCVGTLKAERIDVWSQNLVQGLTLMTSRRRSMFKVIGQRSYS